MIWLLPVFVLAGFLRAYGVESACDRELACMQEEREAVAEGTVRSMRKRENGWAFGLEDCVLRGGAEEDGLRLMGILVYLETEERPRLGSRICVEGTVQAIDAARNPGEFDYRLYYRAQKQNCRMFAENFWEADPDGADWVNTGGYREFLYQISLKAGEILERAAPGDDAGIYKAVLLGDKTCLEDDILALYQKSGISHLLAISGLHLSLFSAAVYGVLRKGGMGHGTAGVLGGVLLCSYAVMTGASTSVIRALVMVLFGYGAACFGRTYDLLTALGAAAAVILWDSPYQITQAGMQLSFSAVAGIGAASPCLTAGLRRMRAEKKVLGEAERAGEAALGDAGRLGWRSCAGEAALEDAGRSDWRSRVSETVLTGMGLQLTTIPVMLYHFFQIPVYGIVLNLIVVPLMGIVLASGAAGILLGSVNPAAGRFAMGSGHAVLRVYEALCRISSRAPGNVLVLGRPEMRQVALYYVSFICLLLSFSRGDAGGKFFFGRANVGKKSFFSRAGIGKIFSCCQAGMEKKGMRRKRVIRCAAMLGMVLALRAPAVAGLETTFLDVGQGDGIVIRTHGHVILVDGGSTDVGELGRYRLEPYLKSIGETTVDLAVVTHGDMDHISGLQYLIEESEEILVKCLALPEKGRGQQVYEELKASAEAAGGTVIWMKRGDVLETDGLKLTCLYPDGEGVGGQSGTEKEEGTVYRYEIDSGEDRNEHSLVLKVDYGAFHMLLTGDMSQTGEEFIQKDSWASAYLENTQVLKVAHHGSKYSTGDQWLGSVRPRWAVISYGEGNRYGHPHTETLERLEKGGTAVYETGKSGAITLNTDGKKVEWHTWLQRE